jgi:hypothetical protein
MKKTYMKPATLLTAVSVHKMICVSTPHVTVSTTGEVEADEVESRRRSNSVWDDEEDDY